MALASSSTVSGQSTEQAELLPIPHEIENYTSSMTLPSLINEQDKTSQWTSRIKWQVLQWP
jgi:hypothetical protein